MGKQTLIRGILIGAVVGGLATLSNKEVRTYIKESTRNCVEQTSYMIKNRSQIIDCAQSQIQNIEETFTNQVGQVENLWEQIEEVREIFFKK
ncbi:MAG TPA: YtxH domain-containing protein [Bacillota bacterium]|nr:YtxH domain-containing protein [Bacillota bacterium]